MSRLFQESLLTFATRGLLALVGLAAGAIVARALGPALQGGYSLAVLCVLVASMLFNIGLGPANVYFGARQPEHLPRLAGNALVSGLLLGGLAALVLLLLTMLPAFCAYLDAAGIPPHWLRWMALVLPLSIVGFQFRDLVRGSGDIVRYNLLMLLPACLVLCGVLVLVLGAGWRLGGVLVAWCFAECFSAVVAVRLGVWGCRGRLATDARLFRETLRYGLRLHPGTVAQFLNYRLDVFLVAYFRSPAEVGLYVVATGLAEKLYELPVSLWTVLLYRNARHETDTAAQVSAAVFRLMLVILAVLCGVFAALAYPVIRFLYGSSFLGAVAVAWVLLPGIWLYGAGKILGVHLMATGRPGRDAAAAGFSLAITVLLDLLLIPRYGIMGAALASSIAYGAAAVFLLGMFLRTTGMTPREVLLVRRSDWKALATAVRAPFRREAPQR